MRKRVLVLDGPGYVNMYTLHVLDFIQLTSGPFVHSTVVYCTYCRWDL